MESRRERETGVERGGRRRSHGGRDTRWQGCNGRIKIVDLGHRTESRDTGEKDSSLTRVMQRGHVGRRIW